MSFAEAMRFISQYVSEELLEITYIDNDKEQFVIIGKFFCQEFFELLLEHCFETFGAFTKRIDGEEVISLSIRFIPQIGPT